MPRTPSTTPWRYNLKVLNVKLTIKLQFAFKPKKGCTSGECQTWYHISRVPNQQIVANPELLAVPELCSGLPVYEIVKNRDFDKCNTLPTFNYVSTPGLQCSIGSGASCQNQFAVYQLFSSYLKKFKLKK